MEEENQRKLGFMVYLTPKEYAYVKRKYPREFSAWVRGKVDEDMRKDKEDWMRVLLSIKPGYVQKNMK